MNKVKNDRNGVGWWGPGGDGGGGGGGAISLRDRYLVCRAVAHRIRVQELCESRGGRPGLSVLTSLMVSVNVKQY